MHRATAASAGTPWSHLGPALGYPASLHGGLRAMLQFAGTTVDGEPSAVYPPLLQSPVRY